MLEGTSGVPVVEEIPSSDGPIGVRAAALDAYRVRDALEKISTFYSSLKPDFQ